MCGVGVYLYGPVEIREQLEGVNQVSAFVMGPRNRTRALRLGSSHPYLFGPSHRSAWLCSLGLLVYLFICDRVWLCSPAGLELSV